MILDQHGKPIDLAGLREPQTSHVRHLEREFENHPSRGLTPARLASIMRQAEEGDLLGQLDLADDIEERDGHIYSELAKRKGALLPLEWDIKPPENASAAEKSWAAQAKEWVKSIADFEDIVLAMMDAVLKGFSNHEMVWSLQERVLFPTEITWRPQRWFTVAENRQVVTLRNATHQYGEPLRPYNWISHVHRSRNGYLARGSLSRVLFWPYLFKNFAVRDLAEFLEIYGLPLRLGSYPSGASDKEKLTLLRAVTEIGHNAAGIIPQGMRIDFQNAAQGTDAPFMTFIRYMDGVESKVIVGQTLTSGEGEHGTQALGNVHNEVRMDIRNADARQVAGTLTRQLVHPMCLINIPGADPRRLPVLEFDVGEPEDLQVYAEELPKLAKAGLRISKSWVHNKLRIPEAAADEELLEAPRDPIAQPGGSDDDQDGDPPAPGQRPPRRSGPPGPRIQLKADPRGSDPRDRLDDVVDEALEDWRPMLEPLSAPLLSELDRAIAAGESVESFRERLPDLVAQLDAKAMGEVLARASFLARLVGEADLDLN